MAGTCSQIAGKGKLADLRKGPGLKPIGSTGFFREAEASRSLRKSKRGCFISLRACSGLGRNMLNFYGALLGGNYRQSFEIYFWGLERDLAGQVGDFLFACQWMDIQRFARKKEKVEHPRLAGGQGRGNRPVCRAEMERFTGSRINQKFFIIEIDSVL
jgi:hypothetical protein